MADGLKGKPMTVVVVSPEREAVIRGTVLDVKNGIFYLSAQNEEALTVRPRQQSKGNREGVNTRAFFRLPVVVKAKVNGMTCDVTNISGNGICFRSICSFRLNEVVKLEVPLTKNKTFQLNAKVVRTRVINRSVIEYGCYLVNLSKRDEEALVGAIFQLQRPPKN